MIPSPVPLADADRLRTVPHGGHLCQIFEGPEDLLRGEVPFIAGGLARGESCMLIVHDRSVDQAEADLYNAGIDVTGAQASGALVVADARRTHLSKGHFDPVAMVSNLIDACARARAQGFPACSWVADMTWALDHVVGHERVMEFEALMNEHLPWEQVVVLCEYDRRAFAPRTINDVLRTHPVAVLDDTISCNLYYEPPPVFREVGPDESKIDWMLDQLRRFRDTQSTLEQAVQTRDSFLSIASHELNTPLTSLMLQGQALRDACRRGLDDETLSARVLRAAELSDRQLQRLSILVSNLLDLSRISSSRIKLQREPVDLAEIVRGAAARMRPHLERSGTRIELRTESAWGTWDRSRVEEIVENLLSNAGKFGAGKTVRASVSHAGGLARLVVSDEGPGVPPQDQARIFERFERGTHALSGLGLGLYISREIAEAHGGRLYLQERSADREPRGATFVAELPLGAEVGVAAQP